MIDVGIVFINDRLGVLFFVSVRGVEVIDNVYWEMREWLLFLNFG